MSLTNKLNDINKNEIISNNLNEKNNLITKILQDVPKQKLDKIKNNLLFFQNFKINDFNILKNLIGDNNNIKYLTVLTPKPKSSKNLLNSENDISISTNTTCLNEIKENLSENSFKVNKSIFVKKHINELKTNFSPNKKFLLNKNLESPKNENLIETINSEINLEDLLILQENFNEIKLIILNNKTNNLNNIISLKCLEWINFYLYSSINGNLEQYFIEGKFKELIHFHFIIQLICVMIIYDCSFNYKIIERNKNKILKLLNLLQVNYLIIFDFIISKISISCKNNLWVEKCVNVLKKRLIVNISSSHFIQIKLNNDETYNVLNDLLLIIHVNLVNEENNKNIKDYFYEQFYDKKKEEINQNNKEDIINFFNKYIYKNNNPNSSELLILSDNINKKNSNLIFQKSIKHRNTKLKSFKSSPFQISLYNNKEFKNFFSQNNHINNLNQSIDYFTKLKNKNNNIHNNINNTNNYNYNISYSKPSIHFNKNTTIINKNNINSLFSNNVISKIPNYPLLNYPPKKELTLILDLDETLISFQYSKENKKQGILYLRPGLRIFLKEISELYEIIIFTSSTREYASPIIDKIEKENKFFSARLYREHNIIINNEYIKDISLLGRNIEKVIIVDNMIQNFRLQKDNGILIRWYCGDENDNVLFNLKKLLMRIYEEREDDVRNLIKKYKNEIIRKISSNLEYEYYLKVNN